MNDLIDQEREKYYFTRFNKKNNCLERVDMLTGEAVNVSQPNSNLPSLEYNSKYTLEISDAICELIREGKTVLSVAREFEWCPPVHVIYKWKQLFPDFGQKLDAAYKDRALYHHDKAADIAEMALDLGKEEIPGAKLSADIHLKLMSKSDPARWGDSVKLSGDKDSPLKIIVDTGIKRAGDAGYDQEEQDALEAEFTKIAEKEVDKDADLY